MYIGPIKLLEDGTSTVLYNSNGRIFERSEGVDIDDNREIDETLDIIDKKLFKEKNPWKKKKLKKIKI